MMESTNEALRLNGLQGSLRTPTGQASPDSPDSANPFSLDRSADTVVLASGGLHSPGVLECGATAAMEIHNPDDIENGTGSCAEEGRSVVSKRLMNKSRSEPSFEGFDEEDIIDNGCYGCQSTQLVEDLTLLGHRDQLRDLILEQCSLLHHDIVDSLRDVDQISQHDMRHFSVRYAKVCEWIEDLIASCPELKVELVHRLYLVELKLLGLKRAVAGLDCVHDHRAAVGQRVSSADAQSFSCSSGDETGIGNSGSQNSSGSGGVSIPHTRRWLHAMEADLERVEAELDVNWYSASILEAKKDVIEQILNSVDKDGQSLFNGLQKFAHASARDSAAPDRTEEDSRIKNCVFSLERRWHLLWIQLLEWQCRLDQQIKRIQTGQISSNEPDSDLGEPDQKRRRQHSGSGFHQRFERDSLSCASSIFNQSDFESCSHQRRCQSTSDIDCNNWYPTACYSIRPNKGDLNGVCVTRRPATALDSQAYCGLEVDFCDSDSYISDTLPFPAADYEKIRLSVSGGSLGSLGLAAAGITESIRPTVTTGDSSGGTERQLSERSNYNHPCFKCEGKTGGVDSRLAKMSGIYGIVNAEKNGNVADAGDDTDINGNSTPRAGEIDCGAEQAACQDKSMVGNHSCCIFTKIETCKFDKKFVMDSEISTVREPLHVEGAGDAAPMDFGYASETSNSMHVSSNDEGIASDSPQHSSCSTNDAHNCGSNIPRSLSDSHGFESEFLRGDDCGTNPHFSNFAAGSSTAQVCALGVGANSADRMTQSLSCPIDLNPIAINNNDEHPFENNSIAEEDGGRDTARSSPDIVRRTRIEKSPTKSFYHLSVTPDLSDVDSPRINQNRPNSDPRGDHKTLDENYEMLSEDTKLVYKKSSKIQSCDDCLVELRGREGDNIVISQISNPWKNDCLNDAGENRLDRSINSDGTFREGMTDSLNANFGDTELLTEQHIREINKSFEETSYQFNVEDQIRYHQSAVSQPQPAKWSDLPNDGEVVVGLRRSVKVENFGSIAVKCNMELSNVNASKRHVNRRGHQVMSSYDASSEMTSDDEDFRNDVCARTMRQSRNAAHGHDRIDMDTLRCTTVETTEEESGDSNCVKTPTKVTEATWTPAMTSTPINNPGEMLINIRRKANPGGEHRDETALLRARKRKSVARNSTTSLREIIPKTLSEVALNVGSGRSLASRSLNGLLPTSLMGQLLGNANLSTYSGFETSSAVAPPRKFRDLANLMTQSAHADMKANRPRQKILSGGTNDVASQIYYSSTTGGNNNNLSAPHPDVQFEEHRGLPRSVSDGEALSQLTRSLIEKCDPMVNVRRLAGSPRLTAQVRRHPALRGRRMGQLSRLNRHSLNLTIPHSEISTSDQQFMFSKPFTTAAWGRGIGPPARFMPSRSSVINKYCPSDSESVLSSSDIGDRKMGDGGERVRGRLVGSGGSGGEQLGKNRGNRQLIGPRMQGDGWPATDQTADSYLWDESLPPDHDESGKPDNPMDCLFDDLTDYGSLLKREEPLGMSSTSESEMECDPERAMRVIQQSREKLRQIQENRRKMDVTAHIDNLADLVDTSFDQKSLLWHECSGLRARSPRLDRMWTEAKAVIEAWEKLEAELLRTVGGGNDDCDDRGDLGRLHRALHKMSDQMQSIGEVEESVRMTEQLQSSLLQQMSNYEREEDDDESTSKTKWSIRVAMNKAAKKLNDYKEQQQSLVDKWSDFDDTTKRLRYLLKDMETLLAKKELDESDEFLSRSGAEQTVRIDWRLIDDRFRALMTLYKEICELGADRAHICKQLMYYESAIKQLKERATTSAMAHPSDFEDNGGRPMISNSPNNDGDLGHNPSVRLLPGVSSPLGLSLESRSGINDDQSRVGFQGIQRNDQHLNESSGSLLVAGGSSPIPDDPHRSWLGGDCRDSHGNALTSTPRHSSGSFNRGAQSGDIRLMQNESEEESYTRIRPRHYLIEADQDRTANGLYAGEKSNARVSSRRRFLDRKSQAAIPANASVASLVTQNGPNGSTPLVSLPKRRSLLARALRLGWPLGLSLLLLLGLLVYLYRPPLCCHQQNNWMYALSPHLNYVNGPPPS